MSDESYVLAMLTLDRNAIIAELLGDKATADAATVSEATWRQDWKLNVTFGPVPRGNTVPEWVCLYPSNEWLLGVCVHDSHTLDVTVRKVLDQRDRPVQGLWLMLHPPVAIYTAEVRGREYGCEPPQVMRKDKLLG